MIHYGEVEFDIVFCSRSKKQKKSSCDLSCYPCDRTLRFMDSDSIF